MKGSLPSAGAALGFDLVELVALLGLFVLACTSLAANTYSPFLYFRF